jgi:serine/threonine protein kinase
MLASLFSSVLHLLFEGYWPAEDEQPGTIEGPDRKYQLQRLLGRSNQTEVHLATADTGSPFVVKVSLDSEGAARLDNERKTLTQLLTAAGDTTYRRYLPELIESFPLRSRRHQRVNVFHLEPGLHTLEQVREQHPVLDGRHLAWIFKRLLTVLGFAHRAGVLHGAVLPAHVLLHAPGHGLRLAGWGRSVSVGQCLRTPNERWQAWYPTEIQRHQAATPATDLFLAARCMVYLAGGDPVTNRMPEPVPPSLQRFLATCLLDSPRMRPDNAWALLEDFDALLQRLYGPPKFHPLLLS